MARSPALSLTAYNIICHVGATPGAASVKVAAGRTVELQWTPWPVTHHGPVIDYLANCHGPCSKVDKTRLRFNKIDASGLLRESLAAGQAGFWGADRLRQANNSWTVTVPSTIAAGNYVLRHEIIALHDAIKVNGAQNYPHCINLQVTGSGSDKLPSGTLGTSLYKANEPGIKIDIYKPLVYQMPGPPIHGEASLTPAQEGDYGSTAMKASKDDAPAVPKVPDAQPLENSSAGHNNQKPSTAAPSFSVNPTSTSSESVIPSQSSPTQPDHSNPDSQPKAQAQNPSFQPYHDAMAISTTPKDTPPSLAPASASSPSAAALSTLSPSKKKKKKPCNRPPTSFPSQPQPQPQPQTSTPSPNQNSALSSPPKKKLKKKPCTARRPTRSSSMPVLPQAPNALVSSNPLPPAATGTAGSQGTGTGTGTGNKKLKKKPCKKRRRRNSEL
ncbi:MAG: hypothetical protein Q9191_007064 [Dirinaria sp. TL-2023a]